MLVLIASDLHGSAFYADQLVQIFETSGANLLVLLGDVYNHGPRNPLPQGYAPMEVAATLNKIKDKLLVIRGNCDSEVDDMISEFHLVTEACLMVGGHKVYLTHGHRYHKDNLPAISKGDTLIYGHYHVTTCEDKEGVHILNPGSISLPKDGHRAYILLDDKGAEIRDLDGNTIAKMVF